MRYVSAGSAEHAQTCRTVTFYNIFGGNQHGCKRHNLRINGPIVYIAGDSGFQMNEMVYVGEANLVGEVIGLTSERTTIEVYEETTGLKPGEPVTGTGAPVSVTLAPGIITNILMESNVR